MDRTLVNLALKENYELILDDEKYFRFDRGKCPEIDRYYSNDKEKCPDSDSKKRFPYKSIVISERGMSKTLILKSKSEAIN